MLGGLYCFASKSFEKNTNQINKYDARYFKIATRKIITFEHYLVLVF